MCIKNQQSTLRATANCERPSRVGVSAHHQTKRSGRNAFQYFTFAIPAQRGGTAKGWAVMRRLTSSGIQVHGLTPFWVNTASPITPTLRVSP
jgi:hypothetical protein